MELAISINRESIYDAIKSVTGYTGKNQNEKVDNIMATDDEVDLMGQLVDTAITALVSGKRKYFPNYKNGTITFSVPSNFNLSVQPALTDGIEKYIINRSLSDWFFIARMVEDSSRYMELSNADMAKVYDLLCARTKK